MLANYPSSYFIKKPITKTYLIDLRLIIFKSIDFRLIVTLFINLRLLVTSFIELRLLVVNLVDLTLIAFNSLTLRLIIIRLILYNTTLDAFINLDVSTSINTLFIAS
jgi:hypothetical protein